MCHFLCWYNLCKKKIIILVTFLLLACLGTGYLLSKKDYVLLDKYPFDSRIFTQGLVYHDSELIFSSGEYGKSFLGKFDLDHGTIYDEIVLEDSFFAEGISIFDSSLVLLTWKEGKAFVYDKDFSESSNVKHSFDYENEGWGLASDKNSFYQSDGSDKILIRNSKDFSVEKIIKVEEEGKPLYLLNELEFVNGYIYANVWYSNFIYKIDVSTGIVVEKYNLSSLVESTNKNKKEYDGLGELNGIAYIEDDMFFVTGKNWPYIYKIRLE